MENEHNIKTNKRIKYRLNYYSIISNAKGNSEVKDQLSNIEFQINLCLMSPQIDLGNKITALTLNSFLMLNDKKYDDVFYLVEKIEKIQKKSNGIENFLFIRSLYRGAVSFYDQEQYINAFIYLKKCKNIQDKSKIDQKSQKILNENLKEYKKFLQNQIKNKSEYFSNKSALTDNTVEIINKIFNIKHNINNSMIVYLINVQWWERAKEFFELYTKSRKKKNSLNNLIQKSFDFQNILNKFENNIGTGIYPMEIDNFCLIRRKDQWTDPDNKETNQYLKKDLKENKDYYLLNEEQWKNLVDLFGTTNEIKRDAKEIYLTDFKCLVFFPEMRKERNWNMIKQKHIQISKTKTVYDLKSKILRAVSKSVENNSRIRNKSEYYKKNGESKEYHLDNVIISFYYLPKNKKKLLFEICAAYAYNIQSFPLPCKYIEVKDNESINQFPKDNNQLLLIDIYNKEENEKGFIQIKTNLCTICNKNTEKEKYRCNKCHFNTYCSEECLMKDKVHLYFHSEIGNYLIEEFSLISLFNSPFPDSINRKRKGLVGLENFGNTCYLNSFIQCLSNTIDLAKYFLIGINEHEINQANKMGYSGELSKNFAKLIKSLWLQNCKYISPYEILKYLKSKENNIEINKQQDAQEILSLFLDKLHEDLNRIINKPYSELKEKQKDETDYEASERWWKNHQSREDSIITDLFYGQTKTCISCPKCSKISISFEPYMILSLNIPQTPSSNNVIVTIKYFYSYFDEKDGIQRLRCEVFNQQVNPNSKIKDVKENCLLVLGSIEEKKKSQEKNFFDVVCLDKNKMIYIIPSDNDALINYIEKGDEICVFDKSSFDSYNVYIYPFIFIEEKSRYSYSSKSVPHFLSYPIAISVPSKNTVDQLYEEVLDTLKGCLDRRKLRTLSTKILLKLYIYHYNDKNGSSSNSNSECHFCNNKSSKQFCPLLSEIITSETPLKDIVEIKFGPLILLCNSDYFKSDKDIYPEIPLSNNEYFSNETDYSKEYDLNQLLDYFQSEEKLDELNLWYCNNCKKHQEAIRKVELYRPSNYLIIHMKRFLMKTEKKNDIKINSFIRYPISNLDLRKYILGPERDKGVYELYATINHIGSLNSGHYTAFCKNGDLWYLFNDSKVEEIKEKEVVNKNAYLLFYRRKDIGKE